MLFKFVTLCLVLIAFQEVYPTKINPALTRTSLFGKSKTRSRTDICENTGFICNGCDVSIFCLQLPNGQFIEDPIDCAAGETCSNSAGGECISGINPECDPATTNYKFPCYQVGIFPHIFDCTKYHICIENEDGEVKEESIDYDCEPGFEYDTRTSICSRKADGTCASIVGSCSRVGESGPVSGNPFMFYTCITITVDSERIVFPHIFYCTRGQRYIGGTCRDPTPPTGLDAEGKCTETKKFFVDTDCKLYNECTVNNEPTPGSCNAGNYFDGWSATCKPFECPS